MAHILPQQAEGMTLYETSEKIVHELKSRGIFDTFRKDCLADVDTRPAYQNLRQRVENTVTGFLSKQKWTPELNRNQLRERLRKHLTESRFLEIGVDRIVDQVVDRNIYTTYMPQIRTLVNETLDVRDEKQEPADDDVEMEDVAVPVADGNTFGTWANQFHARVPEPEPPCDRGESSMSISSASTDSQAAVAGGEESSCAAEAAPEPAVASDGCESPDIRAQMSPLSDDGKHTWGSFLGKADGLDFSGLMSNVGRMDPAIDEMIKSELGSARESDQHRRDSPSRGANMSPQDADSAPPLPPPPPPEPRPPFDLHNFVGPSEAENQDGGAYRTGGRDHSGERRHRYSSGSRGDDRDGRGPHRSRDHAGGRHSPDDDRRRRDRDRERSRRMHGEHRSRGESDRHRRDSDRDRGDDHEQQRDRGRHHQRRDRDDDGSGGGGHRAGSGRSVSASGYGHAFGGGSRGRESDRERGSSGQRHHGYHGNGRTAAGSDESPQDEVVAAEVVVETEQEAETNPIVDEEKMDSASKDVGTERKRADSGAKMSSSLRKKSSEKSSSSVGSKGSKERRSSADKKHSSSTKLGSSTGKSSQADIKKSSHSSKHNRGSKFKSSTIKDSNSSASDHKPSHGTKSSMKSSSRKSESPSSKPLHTEHPLDAATGPEKEDSSSNNSIPEQGPETKSEPTINPEAVTSPTTDTKQASIRVPSSTSDVSPLTSESKPAPIPLPTPAPLATNTSDRMAQLMEKYAPHLKDRWQGTPKLPRYTYGGESARPPSPSQHATLRLLRQAEADPDTLSVSSVDTADLSDFEDCLEMEVDVTQPERLELQRLGWRLADAGEALVVASPTPEAADPELIELSDTGDAESVDSGFNRSDASSLSAGSAEAPRMVALTDTEATGSAASSNASRPSSPSLSAPSSAEKRRRKRVDYVALNSGLDGESSVSAVAGRAERRRKRPGWSRADDGEWKPAARRWRGGGAVSPRVELERLPSDGAGKKLECAQWTLSGKESLAGVRQLRDMGAAGDSVRIRPKLAI